MGATIKISEFRGQIREKRPADYGIENALARRQRRLYPTNTIDLTAAEFRITTGQAKGAVYGTASRTTINAILKRGGWALTVELMADVLGQPLEDFIQRQAERARHERERWEEEERAHAARLSDLADLRQRRGINTGTSGQGGKPPASLG